MVKKMTKPVEAKPEAKAKPVGEQTVAKPKGSGLLDSLMGKAKEVKTKPTTAKKDKPVMKCETPDEEAILDQFTAADAIFKVAEAGQTQAKAAANALFKRKFLTLCVQRGAMPDNPHCTSTNSRCNLIVKHLKKLKRGADDPGVREQLEAMGVPEADIAKVEEKIVRPKVTLGLRPFTDLTGEESTPKQQEVAEKLMALVQENFDGDELELLLDKKTELFVEKEWQNLALQVAIKQSEGDEEAAIGMLDALFGVISPQFVLSQMVFSGQLSEAFDKLRLAPPVSNEAKEMIRGDGKYKALIKGNEVSLFLLRPGAEEKFVGSKKCMNPGHAEATAKKLFKDSEYLNEFMVSKK